MQNNNFIIIAHRGESFDAPENTLASVNLAWERNADAVEIDVQLTKDEKIVVIHDSTTLRTGGKFKRIASNHYSELTEVDVGLYKGSEFKNERIPLLEDVINSIPDNKILFIEIKSSNKIIAPLKELIKRKGIVPNQIKFIGFDLNIMKSIKETLPRIESYWIITKYKYKHMKRLEAAINKCKTSGLDGLDVEASKYLNRNVIQTIKKNDLKIYTWTVDDPAQATRLYLDGIDGVTTNRASWIKEKLQYSIIK